jgi:hypothetical protein
MRLILLLAAACFAALPNTTYFAIDARGTAGNLNGGCFDPANGNFISDMAVASANTASPVVTSSSYNFVAADTAYWLFFKSGTGLGTPGTFCKIVSVAGGAATVDASVGACEYRDAWFNWRTNATAGIASGATLTNQTVGIDKSRAIAGVARTDIVIGNPTTTTMTSAGTPFNATDVGNCYHNTAGVNHTRDWFMIASVADGVATVDASLGTAGASSGTGRVGGAMDLTGSGAGIGADAMFEKATATAGQDAMEYHVRYGKYTLGEAVNIAASGASNRGINITGFTNKRGDAPIFPNQPVINTGTSQFAITGSAWNVSNLIFIGASTSTLVVFSSGAARQLINCAAINRTTTADIGAVSFIASDGVIGGFYASYRGAAIAPTTATEFLYGVTVTASKTGISSGASSGRFYIANPLVYGAATTALSYITATTGFNKIVNGTFYGWPTPLGTCISFNTTREAAFLGNNIIGGCVTGISGGQVVKKGGSAYNLFHNNTADTALWNLGPTDIRANPYFRDVRALYLTGAATSNTGNVLVKAGAFSGITIPDSVNGVPQRFVYVSASTGGTTGYYGVYKKGGNDTLYLDLAPGNGSGVSAQMYIATDFRVQNPLAAPTYTFPGTQTPARNAAGAVQWPGQYVPVHSP